MLDLIGDWGHSIAKKYQSTLFTMSNPHRTCSAIFNNCPIPLHRILRSFYKYSNVINETGDPIKIIVRKQSSLLSDDTLHRQLAQSEPENCRLCEQNSANERCFVSSLCVCSDLCRRREPTSTARRGERVYSQINSKLGCEGSRGEREITQSVFPSTAGVLSFSHTFVTVWEVGGGVSSDTERSRS